MNELEDDQTHPILGANYGTDERLKNYVGVMTTLSAEAAEELARVLPWRGRTMVIDLGISVHLRTAGSCTPRIRRPTAG